MVTDRLRIVCPAAHPSGSAATDLVCPTSGEPGGKCGSVRVPSPRHLRGPWGSGAAWHHGDHPSEAKEAAAAIGTPVVVVKAQVKTGGRGKAGGVKVAKSPEEAEARAAEILGLDIKGHVVKTVMMPRVRTSPRSTTSRCCSTGLSADISPCAQRRAGWTSRRLRRSALKPWRASRWILWSASTRPRPMRSSRGGFSGPMLQRSRAYYSCSAPCTRRRMRLWLR